MVTAACKERATEDLIILQIHVTVFTVYSSWLT